ncbi:MAG: YitT family protein [Bacilli bacterium]|nr:YitT family protein [Bacilli bacterium]
MTSLKKTKEKINNYLYDHYTLKQALYHGKGFFFAAISAFIFAFGFTCFISSAKEITNDEYFKIITGGISGLSQNIAKIVEICGGQLDHITIEAIGYTVFNIPLIIFSFFKIGKRFTILTAINVGLSSLFIYLIPQMNINVKIGTSFLIENQPVARVIFGGMCTGLASALAFKGEISCGGVDIVTYYFSLRKSTSVGKYGMIFNGVIVTLYSILIIIDDHSKYDIAIISLFYSVCYIMVVVFIIDTINLRNKKVQLQIITKSNNVSKALLAHFPHGATVVKAEGAYSHSDQTMIYMIVSSHEVKSVVTLARKIDPHAFVTATSLIQVYGNFFIRPVQ